MERALLFTAALLAASLLDFLIGDPPRRTHPVRLIGGAITMQEKAARRLFKSPAGLKAAGLLITILTGGLVFTLVFLLQQVTYRYSVPAGLILETYLLYIVQAGGDLRIHVRRVRQGLEKGSLSQGRAAAAMLVSRDTAALDESGVSRAALESLFENSADGLVAPLFYAALGGPALAALYKAVNTMDSMLGYKNEQYGELGFFPARADDLFSYLPARLTALLILLASFGRSAFRRGLGVLKADRYKHASPNSAWPEAAAAGILNLRFGGTDRYGAGFINRPLINERGNKPVPEDIDRGLALFNRVSFLAVITTAVAAFLLRLNGGGYPL